MEEKVTESGEGPPFVRKTSKSKLAKQSEVAEDSDDPGHKMRIPETRVESFDVAGEGCAEDGAVEEVVEEGAGESAGVRAKVLVRGNALCGDDDTKLRPRPGACASEPGRTGSGNQGSPGSSLSRDSSNEMSSQSHFTDATGIDLHSFILSTLHKNPKDRHMLLNLEEELTNFIRDTPKQVLKFPAMSSYNRMLVHRTAAFFGLDHNVDQSGGSVVVTKTAVTRLHDKPFRKYIQHDNFYEAADGPHKRLSLASTHNQRREIRSFEEIRGAGLLERQKARSFEDRFENLRIMPQDSSSSADIMESPISGSAATGTSGGHGGMAGPGWSSTDSGDAGSHHYLRPLSSNSVPRPFNNVPWRPASSNSLRPHSGSSQSARYANLRSSQKAGSFGGVSSGSPSEGSPAGLASPLPRASPRRGLSSDLGSCHDPSSDPARLHNPIPQPLFPPQPGQQVLFAITSWDSLPNGAILINPATGQPHLNQDGSVYVHPGASPQPNSMPASIPYIPPPGPHPNAAYYQPMPSSQLMGMQLPMEAGSVTQTAGGANVVTYVMPSPHANIPYAYPPQPLFPATAGLHQGAGGMMGVHSGQQGGVQYVESGGQEWLGYASGGGQHYADTHSLPSPPVSNGGPPPTHPHHPDQHHDHSHPPHSSPAFQGASEPVA